MIVVLSVVLATMLSSFLFINILQSIKSDKEISTGTIWMFALCNAYVVGWFAFCLFFG